MQRDKRRNFLVMMKGVGVGFSSRRLASLQPNLQHYSCSICTVPILQLLLQYAEVKKDDDVRGSAAQNVMVSSSFLILFILFFVCTVVCIFAGMYYNTTWVYLCWREVCQSSISCRHVEWKPQLTPTRQVYKNVS